MSKEQETILTKRDVEDLRSEIAHMAKMLELYQKTAETRTQLQDEEVELLKKTVDNHIQLYESQKAELVELVEAVKTIKSGMKITNFLRNAIVWVAGLATAAYSLVQLAKEYFK